MRPPHWDENPPWLLAGRLEGMGLPDLIWSLHRLRKTGLLEVVRENTRKTFYVQDGSIVFACSSDPNDRLGELLLRQGRITLDQLESALRNLHSGKRLGTLLVEAGHLTSDGLVQAVLQQVEATVLDSLVWDEGEYSFHEGHLPSKEAITLQMKTSDLLLQGIRRSRSFARIRRGVGPPRTVYGLRPGALEAAQGLSWEDGEPLVLERLARGDETVEHLCDELFLSNFEVYRTLWALKVLALVEEREWSRSTQDAASHEGALTREGGFAELLVRLSHGGDTGVLYLNRRSVERSFHLQGGHLVFATSNDADDGLLAYLLRRGVISLRDREETAKRLLSNKRVGSILRELGVIDGADLREMVREQIGEIVYDTFRWEDGEYLFVPGPLPTHEEITLDAPAAAFVAEGIRRVTSWTRVIRGCGGVDTPLVLTPHYLELLDLMGAGEAEWAVVNALKNPQSPRRVCRHVGGSDFRTCQILWTLKLLGAVSDVAEETDEPQSPEIPGAFQATLADDLRRLPSLAAAAGVGAPTSPPSPAGRPSAAEEVAAAVSAEPEWPGPADLETIVRRFNAMHRVVFSAVRAEIGAGAANFVRSCCGEAPKVTLLDGVTLRSDGSWDEEALKLAVQRERVEDPWRVYQELLDREFIELNPHLGEVRAEKLKRRIWELQNAFAAD